MTEEQYNQAETFWTRKDAQGKKMDPKELFRWIDEFLSGHHEDSCRFVVN